LSADGTTLLYSTYFNEGYINSLAVDNSGAAYITGQASASTFPVTPGALNNAAGGAFVTKLNSAGTNVVYSAVLGGLYGTAIKPDSQGEAYVLGVVDSAFRVTGGAFETNPCPPWNINNPMFVAKLNSSGSAFAYATYLAGAAAHDVDPAGNTYVIGQAGLGFPVTSGAFQRCMNGGGDDTFLAELSPTGSLSAASYLGGSGYEQPLGIVALACGIFTAAGITGSADFPGIEGADTGQSLLFVETLQIDNPSSPDGPCIALAVQNGASFIEGAITYLEIITIRGAGIGPAQGVSPPTGPGDGLPTDLAGVQVLVGAEPAPLLYVQADQINVIAPSSVQSAVLAPGDKTVSVQVRYNGASTNIVSVPVTGQAPGLFPTAVVNQDGTLNSFINPAKIGSVISLFGTGADFIIFPGILPPNPQSLWPLTPLIPASNPAPVTISGTAADILYFGAAPGSLLGVIQINNCPPPQPVRSSRKSAAGRPVSDSNPGRHSLKTSQKITPGVSLVL
jgi:uncharacterized protein (TIGR03437 family)